MTIQALYESFFTLNSAWAINFAYLAVIAPSFSLAITLIQRSPECSFLESTEALICLS